MRACSRCAPGEVSACFGGSGRLTCGPLRIASVQLATSIARAASISQRTVDACPDGLLAIVTTSAPSVALQNLDLLRTARLHPGAAPLLDPSADTHHAAGQFLRLEAGRGKHALVALGDGDGEVLRPAPAEIDVNRPAALTYRKDLALDQSEPPAARQHLRRFPCLGDGIVWFGPEAKLCGARRILVCQKLFGAGGIADAGTRAGAAARDEIGLQPAFGVIVDNENVCRDAAVTVGFGSGAKALEHDRPAARQGCADVRLRDIRDAGEPHGAAVLKRDLVIA